MPIVYIFFFILIIFQLKTIIIINSIVIIFFALILFGIYTRKNNSFNFSLPEIYFLISFLIIPALSNFYSISRYNTLNGIFENISYILLLLVLKVYGEEKKNQTFLLFLSCVMILPGLAGLFSQKSLTGRLMFGDFKNPNHLADIFGAGIIFLIFLKPSGKFFKIILLYLAPDIILLIEKIYGLFFLMIIMI